jgi:hypothetical protein
MNPKIDIAIKKPCSENFNNFQLTGKGGFCTSCQKEVTDFRRMTDQEIQNYFKIQKQNTCGYFLESQLKTNSFTNNANRKQNFNPFGVSIISFSLLSLLTFNNSFAQKPEKKFETNTVQKEKTDTPELNATTSTRDIIISGTVTDENKQALPGASIVLKHTNVRTSTDFDGKFTIHIPMEQENVLVITYIGYKPQEAKASEKNNIINLKLNPYAMLGEVSVNRIYKSKRSFFDKLKNIFKNE